MPGLVTAVDAYASVAEQLADPREMSQASTARATIALIEGRYSDSERLSAEALEHGKASGDFNAELIFYAQGLLRAVDQGLAGDVLGLLLDAGDYLRIPAFAAGTVLVAALAGELDESRRRLDQMMRDGFGARPLGADMMSSLAFLAHACFLVGAAEHAGELYARLAARPPVAVRVGPLGGWWGPKAFHMGCLARLLGRSEQAESHLRQGLDVALRMEAGPFAARSAAELAVLLADREDPEAKRLADLAVAQAAAIDAAGVQGEVATRLGGSVLGRSRPGA